MKFFWKCLENFLKTFKKFLLNFNKNFLHFFWKFFEKVFPPPEKNLGYAHAGMHEKFLQSENIFLRKLQKMHNFHRFLKKFYKLRGNFSHVWTKTTSYWVKMRASEKFKREFNWKFEFFLFFGKVVANNRAFGKNIILQQKKFSISGGGGNVPYATHPWRRHCFCCLDISLWHHHNFDLIYYSNYKYLIIYLYLYIANSK